MPESIDKDQFVRWSAEERIEAVDRLYGREALLLTSLQKTSVVLLHMIAKKGAATRLLFVDTQFHFPETLAFRDEIASALGLTIETVVPEYTPEQQFKRFGMELYNYEDGQPLCCEARKEEPFLKAAKGVKATLNGLMRAEGGARGDLEPSGWDKRLGCPVYRPIFDWTHERVDEYTERHRLPVHPLYALNYLSIGCAPCTTPVLPGEDRRAGRWRHLRREDGSQPRYCNINLSDGGGI